MFITLFCSCSTTKYASTMIDNKNGMIIPNEMELVYQKKLFFINLKLNGKNAKFLVDTGASVSLLDINQMNRYGFTQSYRTNSIIGLGGSINYTRIRNAKLLTKNNESVLVNFYGGDLSTIVNNMGKDGIHIVGIIGSDFLMDFNAIIDYKNKKLELSKTFGI